MISKELLSEVLGKTVDIVYTKDHVGNDFKTFIRPRYGDFLDEINIYELAHKCKEWAYKQKQSYRVTSGFTNLPDYDYEAIIENPTSTGTKREIFEADSEPEAVFQACQYILENKDKQ